MSPELPRAGQLKAGEATAALWRRLGATSMVIS